MPEQLETVQGQVRRRPAFTDCLDPQGLAKTLRPSSPRSFPETWPFGLLAAATAQPPRSFVPQSPWELTSGLGHLMRVVCSHLYKSPIVGEKEKP